MSKMEYPYCTTCEDYDFCQRNGFTIYKPRFLQFEKRCNECPYDYKCSTECCDYLELCLNDLDVAREHSNLLCYKKPLPTFPEIIHKAMKSIKTFIKSTIKKGETTLAEIKRILE